MSNTEVVADFISKGNSYCDDCLSEALDIKPRQQVNQICNKLVVTNVYKREIRPCMNCTKDKLITYLD